MSSDSAEKGSEARKRVSAGGLGADIPLGGRVKLTSYFSTLGEERLSFLIWPLGFLSLRQDLTCNPG